MHNNTARKCGLVLILAATLLCSTFVSALTDKELNNQLQQLQDTISLNQPFKLVFDPAFPCHITLFDSKIVDKKIWEKSYQFNLEDIEEGTHFFVRDHRRLIIYSAKSTSESGDIKEFSPRRINNVRYPMVNDAENIKGQRLIDTIINECRDRNNF